MADTAAGERRFRFFESSASRVRVTTRQRKNAEGQGAAKRNAGFTTHLYRAPGEFDGFSVLPPIRQNSRLEGETPGLKTMRTDALDNFQRILESARTANDIERAAAMAAKAVPVGIFALAFGASYISASWRWRVRHRA